jgi:hypothetical protein
VLIMSALPLKADVAAVGRESPHLTQSGNRGFCSPEGLCAVEDPILSA